jgi:hypothetical protein
MPPEHERMTIAPQQPAVVPPPAHQALPSPVEPPAIELGPENNQPETSGPIEPVQETATVSPQQPVPPTTPPEPSSVQYASEDTRPESTTGQTPPSLPKTPKRLLKRTSILLAAVVVAAGLCGGSYYYGLRRGKTNQQTTDAMMMLQQTKSTALTVPAGATIISQCTPGEGTQYVLPQNIPMGPIYNVYNKKVIGIEFMIDQNSLSQNTYNLSLANGVFNHLDIIYEPEGHAGFTTPHDHFVFSTISYSQEKKITCSGQSTAMDMSM